MSSSRRFSRRVRDAALATLSATMLVLVLSAQAEAIEVPNHVSKGGLIGGVKDPCGVVVNSKNEIYVSDYYRDEIGVWEPVNGTYGPLLSTVAPSNGPCTMALDNADNLYVNYWHGPVVKYSFPTYQASTVIDSGPATGIALDRSNGTLYVNDRTSVAVYAAPVTAEAPTMRLGTGTLLDGYGVAVSSFAANDNRVYVGDAADHTVKAYEPATSLTVPVQTLDGAGTKPGRFVSLVDASLMVDQSNGHIFVADNTQPGFEHPAALIDEFNAQGFYRGLLATVVHGEPVGLAVNELPGVRKGDVYVTSGNGNDLTSGLVLVFGPAGAGQLLTVTKSGAGSGSVTSSPAGISCGSACKAEFNSGAVIPLTATAAAGSVFAGWTGPCTGTANCQVTMSAAASVNAEFVPAPAPPGLAAAGFALSARTAVTSATAAEPTAARPHRKRAHKRVFPFARNKSLKRSNRGGR